MGSVSRPWWRLCGRPVSGHRSGACAQPCGPAMIRGVEPRSTLRPMAVSDDHEELAPRLKRLSSCGPEVSQTDDSEFDINSRRSKQRSRQRKMGKLLEEAQVIDFLLERGFADANARCKQTGLCPLHIAAKTLGRAFLGRHAEDGGCADASVAAPSRCEDRHEDSGRLHGPANC